MSEHKKCPKCGGEMEKGHIPRYGGESLTFISYETTQWRGLAGKRDSTIAYACKVCGYIEIYRNTESV